jgi:preprotein translocase SecE subunit
MADSKTKVRRVKAQEAEIVKPAKPKRDQVSRRRTGTKTSPKTTKKPARPDNNKQLIIAIVVTLLFWPLGVYLLWRYFHPKDTAIGKPNQKVKTEPPAIAKPFVAIGRYVKASWQELRQTRWPNRRATWGLTIAVILFSIFFAALILSADNLFDKLVEMILNMKGTE